MASRGVHECRPPPCVTSGRTSAPEPCYLVHTRPAAIRCPATLGFGGLRYHSGTLCSSASRPPRLICWVTATGGRGCACSVFSGPCVSYSGAATPFTRLTGLSMAGKSYSLPPDRSGSVWPDFTRCFRRPASGSAKVERIGPTGPLHSIFSFVLELFCLFKHFFPSLSEVNHLGRYDAARENINLI